MTDSRTLTYGELSAIYGVIVIFTPWVLLVSALSELKRDVPLGMALLIMGVAGMVLPLLSYLIGWWILTVIQIIVWILGLLICLTFAMANSNQYNA